MRRKWSRRQMLKQTGGAMLLGGMGVTQVLAATRLPRQRPWGAIIGESAGAEAGRRVMADGGNAVDAAVAAALTACVATPARCGIAGYGGHMTIAFAGGRKITSIDFNTTAPQSATEDMFPLDDNGEVKDRINTYGWLAAGVPGTLAGLQFALQRHGTRSFRELVQPAIAIAKEGFVVTPTFEATVLSAAPRFRADPGSARLYLDNGGPRKAGERVPNPELAELLSALADKNSVDAFYRGDIAQRIGDAFREHGGLVTAGDLAAYHAAEVHPLRLKWNDFELSTAPLTAGGLTIVQSLEILKTLRWTELPKPAAAHALVETLRLAWKDRLELLGDPEKVSVPVKRLLSDAYIERLAGGVKLAINRKTPLELEVPKHHDEGTNNISCVDGDGNMVAITFTQGSSFGAQVTIAGLGLTLGHGMSRFNPQAGHPNSPGGGKRPLHNMCPSIVSRSGHAILAIGGAGGLKIPTALFDALREFICRTGSLEQAIGAPRLHSTGTLNVLVEKNWPPEEVSYLQGIGFKPRVAENPARVSAVSFEPKTGHCRAQMR